MLYLLFIISELLPVVFYLAFHKRNKQEGLQVIFAYCLFSFAMEFLAPLLKNVFHVNGFYLYSAFTIIEYFLQLRSVSNDVGQRDKSKWDFKASIAALNSKLAGILEDLTPDIITL